MLENGFPMEATETAWEVKGLIAQEESECMQGEEWYLHQCIIPHCQNATQLHAHFEQICASTLCCVIS